MTRLELADLEQIVLTVRRARGQLGGREGARIGGFKRAAFRALRLVAFSIPIALAILLLGIYLFDWGGSLGALALLAWILLASLLLLPLTLLNLPLIVTAWKQRRPIVSRGLLVPAFPAWQRKARWVVLAVTAAAVILAATVDAFGWSGLILVLVVVVFPFLLLMLQSFLGIAQRNLQLLRQIDDLQGVLEEKLTEARRDSRSQVELSHEEAVKLSATTEGLARGERLRAIDDSMRADAGGFSVSQSASFRQGLQEFEPAVRLLLLDRVQELALDHRPQGARREAGGEWVWSLAEPGVELIYEIRESARQVLVREARLSGAGRGDDGSG